MTTFPTRAPGIYAALSAGYWYDDAILAAGVDAEVLFVRALAFCAGNRSDGFISELQVTVVGQGLTDLENRTKTLIAHGLWAADEDRHGFVVRSWLKWNRSAEEIDDFRARDAERKRAARVKPASGRTSTRTSSGRPDGRPAARPLESNTSTGQDTVLSDTECPPRTARAPEPAAAERRPVPAPPEIQKLRRQLNAKRGRVNP